MTATERLAELADTSIVPVEPERGLVRTPPDWPSAGRIVFDNVCLRYRPEMPLALRGLSFTIEAGTWANFILPFCVAVVAFL